MSSYGHRLELRLNKNPLTRPLSLEPGLIHEIAPHLIEFLDDGSPRRL
jgi:hypothetical protein